MAAPFIDAVARSNRQLLRLVQRFNCRPAADLHPEWLAGHLDAGLFERLRRFPRAERQLSDWVVRRFELDPRGHWEFSEPRFRLALLRGQQLERLATLVGIAAMHRLVAKAVLGPHVRRLKASLGEADFQFAVKRASFLVRQLPAELETASIGEDPAAQATELGWRALRGCLAGAPPAIMERLALKLSPAVDVRRPAPLAAVALPAVYRLVQRTIAFEVDPELAPCFT